MPRTFVERRALVADLLEQQAGVVSRKQLRERGIDRYAVRAEVAAGRWAVWGAQTVAIAVTDQEQAMRWSALFEVGAGARLDGVTSLLQAGLTGWSHDAIDIVIPHEKHYTRRPGIRLHTVTGLEPGVAAGIPRSRVVPSTIRAIQWARTDAQAATVLAMVVQQRLAHPDALLHGWSAVGRARRRGFLDQVMLDLCAGAQALDELRFTQLCRKYALPAPEQQAVLVGPRGRIYRDARWPGLTVEIDGAQHWAGIATVDDVLRANGIAMSGDMVLRIPVLGLRLREAQFMGQVVQAYRRTR